jgi:hypothetical protein
MPRYTLEINDVDYSWSSLYYKRTAPITEDPINAVIPGKQTVTGEHKIKILEDGVAKTTDRVHGFGYVKGRDGVSTKVIGSTLERDATETETFARIDAVAQPNIRIENDITQIHVHKVAPRLEKGTLDAFGSTLPFEFGSDWENRWKIRECWQRIALVSGWEIYVSPTGIVDFQSACGVDRGKTPGGGIDTVKFQTGENIMRWTNPHFEDHTMIAGEVLVIGRKEGVFQAYGSSGAAQPTRKVYLKDLHTPDMCETAAASIDADMGNALVTGRFNAIDAGLTYDVYDTVQIVDKDYGVDGDYRIYGLEKWINPERIYASIFYTNLTKMTGNGPLLIDRGKRTLMKGQEALKQVTTTPLTLREESRLFKYIGEDTTGYTLTQAAGGTVTVAKDFCTLSSGAGLGQSIIESSDPVMDFESDLSLDFRFQINNIVDAAAEREFWIGTWNVATSKGIYFYLSGYDLDAQVYNGVGNTSAIHVEDPIDRDQWYRCSAYKRNDKVYVYFDSVYIGSISADVPTTGTTTTLYAQQLPNANAGGNNYEVYLDLFELYEKHVPEY